MNKYVKVGIVLAIVILSGLGFFYFITLNGFSTHHAGITIFSVDESGVQRYAEDGIFLKNLTEEDLEEFPRIITMLELLLEEKSNYPGQTRTVIVGFESYRIFVNEPIHEISVQNYMSDSGASNLSKKVTDELGTFLISYKGHEFAIGSWIA